MVCYLMPGAMYWIARQTKWTQRAAMVLLGSLALFGIYLAITRWASTSRRGGWCSRRTSPPPH